MRKPTNHFQFIADNPENAPLFWNRLEYLIQYWTGRTKEMLRQQVPGNRLRDIENDVMNIFVHVSALVARLYDSKKTTLNFFTQYKLHNETRSYARCLCKAKLKREFQSYDAIRSNEDADSNRWEPETPNEESLHSLLIDLESFLPQVPESAKEIYALRIKGYTVTDIMSELKMSENVVRYQLKKAFKNISY